MKFKSLILLGTSLFILSCGDVKDKDKGEDGGDGQNQKISSRRKTQVKNLLGAIGDIGALARKYGRSGESEGDDRRVDRKMQRRLLEKTARLNRCQIKEAGSMGESSFAVKVTGGACKIELEFEQKRKKIIDTFSTQEVVTSFEKYFSVHGQGVSSDLVDATMEGRYRYLSESESNGLEIQRSVTGTIKGFSKVLKRFEYSLSETYEYTKKKKSGRSQAKYERVDRLKVQQGFNITLFRWVRFQDDKPKSGGHFINGQSITEKEYLDIFQDFNFQVGIDRFKMGKQ